MKDVLKKWAAARGYLITWSDSTVVDEVHLELERRRAAGEIDEYLYNRELNAFTYLNNAETPRPSTVFVLAVPRPAHLITFDIGSNTIEAVVPPTYLWYAEVRDRVRRELEAALPGRRCRLVNLSAPLKALAARLGLVKYGRNNITYAPGLGSYHQLMAFLADARLEPLADPGINATQTSPECEYCHACFSACPTGAIGFKRFLLNGERCLTLYSEYSGPWPDWLPVSAHNCLVGCMICQKVCPRNTGLLRVEPSGVSFSEEETRVILDDSEDRSGPVWEAIRARLDAVGLADYDRVIGRNLRALMAR
ncbi:MAG: 4Fe-4S double cluster binding domain-containing protein [Bacillota bacterium]